MPAKSKAQARFMRAAASNPKLRKKTGLTKAQAEEYVKGKPTKGLPERKKKRGKK